MRIAIFFIYMLAFSHAVFSQTVAQMVANETCGCIGAAAGNGAVDEKVQKCLPEALAKVMEKGTEEERKGLSTVGGVQETIFQARKILAENCRVIRDRALEIKRSTYYTSSLSGKANTFFWEGNELMEKELYAKAARKFKKAIREDKHFVLAMDHLAISCRKMEDYNNAVKWYERSLAVFPEGEVALLNLAIVHSLKNDLDNSAAYYKQFASIYPNSPEGYFGLAKISILSGKYEQALENILIAHKMYVDEDSEYSKDSHQLISLLYHKFNELKKDDVFLTWAEAYGIEISLNDR